MPPDQRSSKPRRIFVVFFGASMSIMIAVYGGLMVEFGLSFWAAMSAVLVGNLIGLLFVCPMILFGPRTGTNNQIGSSAHYGIIGRLIGSGISLATCLIFGAVAVWSSGDALLALVSRAVGHDISSVATRLAAYVLVTVGVATVAIYGHHVIVRAYERLILPAGMTIFMVGIVAYSGPFNGTAPVKPLALDGFWPTWVLAVVVVASIPVSYTPMMGDYARYVPEGTSDAKLSAAAGGGLFFGNLLTMGFGVFVAHAVISNGAAGFVTGMVEFSPGWYLPFAIVLIMTGAIGQATMSLYSSGLDLEAIVARLSRIVASVITAGVTFALVIIGTVVLAAGDSIAAASTLLVVVTVPWALINIIGLIRTRGRYDAADLQAFTLPDRAGTRYWFTRGWNVSASAAWALGSIVGLCATSTSLYEGPLVSLFKGVDVSIPMSCVVAAAIYFVMLRLRPDDRPESKRPSVVVE